MAKKEKTTEPTLKTKKIALYVGKTFVYKGQCGFDSHSFKRYYKRDLEESIPYGKTCLVVKESTKRVEVLINGRLYNISKFYLSKEVEQAVNPDTPLCQLKNILSDTQDLIEDLECADSKSAINKLYVYQTALRNVITQLEDQ